MIPTLASANGIRLRYIVTADGEIIANRGKLADCHRFILEQTEASIRHGLPVPVFGIKTAKGEVVE